MTIEVRDIFSPMTTEEFLNTVWGLRPHVISRNDARFRDVLPWQVLNDILASNRLDYTRFRLTKEGRNIPAEAFLSFEQTRVGTSVTRLNVAGLHQQVADGATLVLDAAEEMVSTIDALAGELERLLGEYVRAHVFVGWQNSQGLATHWDAHDVLLLQVHGSKDWTIYEPTREHPMLRDIEFDDFPEDTKPYLSVRLNPGDFLYIPRGWWHDSRPCGEPTLHVSFSVKKRTGIDYIEALSEKLCEDVFLRADVPRFATADQKDLYIRQLRERVISAIDTLPLDRYLDEQNSRASLGRQPSLPWPGVQEDLTWLRPDSLLSPQIRRNIALQHDGENITIAAGGKEYTLGIAAQPILKFVVQGRPAILADILAQSEASGASTAESVELLQQLVSAGLISAR
ncbi:hypothetical protein WS67_11280 [Burkholderia singularis]|uniref:JmjC domain-containing protein n=1 Tax=Burkholderia singularis TaxID=1503053 RepID=A0A118DP68_9BURK|nr:cupin domain-containing protein [Burkholderia singularis]KVE27593.1 hypothetical protein WS67_11280 [Burkholderia singularis]